MTDHDILPFAVLGIPVCPFTLPETLERIEHFIQAYRKDERPRYIATLNVDFLVNTHGWLFDKTKSDELLHILRTADLVTLDGMPLVWFSKALSAPVQERVTGVDLVSALASKMATLHHSLFLLGGDDKVLRLAALYLEAENPRIKIAGISSAQISIHGTALKEQEKNDQLLIDQINRANPTVLLLNLGHPKQEVWFERVKERLKVPVTIGVGGTFNLLTGMVPRAPEKMQRLGLEWLYRLYQEPGRLLKRYTLDLIKFPIIAIPPLVYSFPIRHNKEEFLLQDPLLFIAAHQTFSLQQLPAVLDSIASRELHRRSEDLLAHEKLVLDFSNVSHISLEGMAWLIQIWLKGRREGKQVLALSVPASIRAALRLHRVWDLLEIDYCETARHALEQINYQEQMLGFYDAIDQRANEIRLTLFGNVDRHVDADDYLEKRGPLLQYKNCLLDLRYCTYMDNSGQLFIQRLKNYCLSHFSTLEIAR